MLKFLNAERTLISFASEDGAKVVVVEKGDPRFDELAAHNPAEFEGESQEDARAAERAAMVVSRFQAKVALFQAGILGQIEELLRGSENFIHRLAWDEAVEFRRDSPTINFLAKHAGLSDEALDDLFRAAMTIRA